METRDVMMTMTATPGSIRGRRVGRLEAWREEAAGGESARHRDSQQLELSYERRLTNRGSWLGAAKLHKHWGLSASLATQPAGRPLEVRWKAAGVRFRYESMVRTSQKLQHC